MEFDQQKLEGDLLETARTIVGFTDSDILKLQDAAPRLIKHLPGLSDIFYNMLLASNATQVFFTGPEQIERLKQTLQVWAKELFTLPRNDEYLAKRLVVGRVHVELKIETSFVLAAMGHVRRYFSEKISEEFEPPESFRLISSLGRAADVDLILITESYQYSQRLKDLTDSNIRLKRILDQAPVAVFGYDNEGKIVDWNPEAENLYGYQSKDALGEKLVDLISLPEDREMVQATIGRVFAGEVLPLMDRTQVTSEGRILKTIVAHAPIRGAEGIVEGFAFCLDTTEISILRDKMMDQEKMAALGTLAAGVAHEVGNPLASISAICQLIHKKSKDQKLKERITQIQDAISRIDSIVKRILNFARKEERIGIVDVGKLITEVMDLIGFDRRLKSVSIVREISDSLSEVKAPRSGLIQVLINLILNAGEELLDFREDPEIIISCKRVRNGTEILIKDNGPGFSEESLQRGIEPFYSSKELGTGLGLAISYGIIKRSGGTLDIKNDKVDGKVCGARVAIWLPEAR
ncbi:MAG: PAS domain S-box protein [Candidatus Lindowbacteria bacterium]|nr:PAS domain S-box protein [Candidatus Lindowbacteria bacterium]